MSWLERYFYKPSFYQKLLAFLLLPLSWIYILIAVLNTGFRRKISFDIPIISVGNISIGGNGKTPMCKAIAAEFEGAFVVLRGYKRKSKGLIVVSYKRQINCDISECGDEAYEYALDENIAAVIVSEDRKEGIKEAIRLGAALVILDDAFSKFYIKKFDLLLFSKQGPYFDFCLPAGCLRLPLCFSKRADFLAYEGVDFKRFSFVRENPKAILITTIAKPFRLHEHFIKARACYFFSDHAMLDKDELSKLLNKHNCDTLMLTMKDFVKVKDFGFKTQIIDLKLCLLEPLKEALTAYILENRKENDDNNTSKTSIY